MLWSIIEAKNIANAITCNKIYILVDKNVYSIKMTLLIMITKNKNSKKKILL